MKPMNTDEQLELREQVSALADGQLGGEAFASVVERLGVHEDARASWHLYHLIGDVLRSDDMGPGLHDRAFVSRLSERLQTEPGVPRVVKPGSGTPEIVADNVRGAMGYGSFGRRFQPPANDRAYRWKMLAAMATVVAVAAVVWNGLGVGREGVQLAQRAAAERVEVAVGSGGREGAETGVMIRDPRLDELLAAHRQFGGASALQNPAGFLRSATLDAQAVRPVRVAGP